MSRIVLKKGREHSLLRRHPWVFSGAVEAVRDGDPVPGETVDIVSHGGDWLARGAFSPDSNILARVWTFARDETVDASFFARRIASAVSLRLPAVGASHLLPASCASWNSAMAAARSTPPGGFAATPLSEGGETKDAPPSKRGDAPLSSSVLPPSERGDAPKGQGGVLRASPKTGRGGASISEQLQTHAAAAAQVVFLGTDSARVRSVADAFEAGLERSDFASVSGRIDEHRLQELVGFYAEHRAGLLSDADRVSLLEGESGRARLVRRSVRAVFSPVPALFQRDEDPFRLLDSFVKGLLTTSTGAWREEEGWPTATAPDGRTAVLLSLVLPSADASDLERLPVVVGRLERLRNAVASDDVEILFSGVPFHTVDIAGRCKRDIAVLSVFSLVFILSLALFVFRSVRPLAWIAAALLFSSVCGFTALALLFPRFHLLSCVFGTTLLGLTVDYSFHTLLSRDSQRTLRNNLFLSWATTLVGVLPLFLSGLPVLVQTATFLAAGLTAALAFVLVYEFRRTEYSPLPLRGIPPLGGGQDKGEGLRSIFPHEEGHTRGKAPLREGGGGNAAGGSTPSGTPARPATYLLTARILFAILLFAALLIGLPRLRLRNSLADLHRPSPSLVQSERIFHELNATKDGASGFLLFQGNTLDEALAHEEAAADLLADAPRLSRLLPSLSRRTENAALVETFRREQGGMFESYCHFTPLPAPDPKPWSPAEIPDVLASRMLLPAGETVCTVVPGVSRPETPIPGAVYVSPTETLSEFLVRYQAAALRLLALAGTFLVVLLAVRFRLATWKILLPSIAGISAGFALLGLLGTPLNLFHILACFMLLGMSLDYTIFLASDCRRNLRSVSCSLLTSLAGFGALAFVSFPLVRSMGQILGVGLTVSYAVSLLLFASPSAPAPEAAEQAASPLGMEILYRLYRLFGKRTLDRLALIPCACAWAFHPAVRRRAGSFRKLRNFVQTLVDKLVVLSDGPEQPVLVPDDHPDTRDFFADLAARKGIFMLTSHLGNAEALPALGKPGVVFHAFLHREQTAIFNAFCANHAKRTDIRIHPVSGFDVGTVFEAGSWLDDGDCLVMAGDRGFGRTRPHAFRNGTLDFPVGVFRLAKTLEHPVYFAACIQDAPNHYRVLFRHLPCDDTLFEAYLDVLAPLVDRFPDQWYHWNFISQGSPSTTKS